MGTTADKLTYLSGTKDALKTAINYTGANITNDTFRSYADKLKLGYIDMLNNGTDTLYDNLPKVSGKGSNLSLTPTYEAPMRNIPYGDTLQDGTPTPSSPISINNVTGLQKVNVCGKNLFDGNMELGNFDSSGVINSSTTRKYSVNYIRVNPSTTYVSNKQINRVCFYDINKNFISRSSDYNIYIISIPSNAYYIRFDISTDIATNEIQIEKGSTASTFEEYKGQSYEINLGKNLFDKDATPLKNYGTTITSLDTGVRATLTTATSNRYSTIPIPNSNNLLGKTITLSATITKSGNANGCIRLFELNSSGDAVKSLNLQIETTGSVTMTIPSSYTSGVMLGLLINSNLNNSNAQVGEYVDYTNLQLEKDSTASSYSNYFTPIELNKIGNYQDSIKKSTGKNLWNSTNVVSGYGLNSNNAGTYSQANRSYLDYTEVKSSTTYTLSNVTWKVVQFLKEDKTFISSVQSGNTFTTPSNCKYVRISFDNSLSYSSVQLELGNTTTDPEPYGKVWYIENKIGKVILDGSETYETSGTNTSGKYKIRYNGYASLIKKPETANIIGNIISNQFIPLSANDTYRCNQGISIETNGKISFYDETITQTTNAFTTWLSSNNMIIYYGLNTPTYTEITNTDLINQLEALYTAKSKSGITNIFSTSENLPMILSASALKVE